MRFGHIDETGKQIVSAPSFYQNEDGTTTFSPSEATHNAHGNYRVANNAPETSDDYTAVFDGYELVGNVIRTAYRYEPVVPPPKVYNKYRLVCAVNEAHLLTELTAYMAAHAEAKMLWDAAQEFNEADEYFKGIRNRLIGEFGEEAVTAVLKAAEV